MRPEMVGLATSYVTSTYILEIFLTGIKSRFRRKIKTSKQKELLVMMNIYAQSFMTASRFSSTTSNQLIEAAPTRTSPKRVLGGVATLSAILAMFCF